MPRTKDGGDRLSRQVCRLRTHTQQIVDTVTANRKRPARASVAEMTEEEVAERGVSREDLAKIERRIAYLITNRRYRHELTVLIGMFFTHGAPIQRDVIAAAMEVHAWWHEHRGECLVGSDRAFDTKAALDALRPNMTEKPRAVPDWAR